MSFNDLKKNRSDSMQKLVAAAAKLNERSFENNAEEFWTPTRDKSGNGYAVIRFLPAAKGDDVPWVRFWDHGFKSATGKWYIEKSLTSIGQPDPLAECNSKLWNSGIDADKEVARARKRRLHYVANILVVTDKDNPANDGKVMKYKFGKKIFDKVMDSTAPKFADEAPLNPFDLWEGANFKLKIQTIEGFPNYDKSGFADASAVYNGDDAKLEKLYDSLKTLKDFSDPSKYKTYEELLKRLKFVIGEEEVVALLGSGTAAKLPKPSAPAPRASAAPVKDEDADEAPSLPTRAAPSTTVKADEEDAEDDAFFAKLAR